MKGGPFGEKNFRKKSLAVPKKIGRGDPLVSPGMVWYAGKTGKTVLVQFARPNSAIWYNNYFVELLRTLLVSSCGLKKKATIIVAFHFMKRRLKMNTD